MAQIQFEKYTFITRYKLIVTLIILLLIGIACTPNTTSTAGTLSHPILFVTQVPVPADFTTIGSTFGNHLASIWSVARGGDLWVRYPNGTLKNLTEAAGYGMTGFQGANSIAVRDPAVHWDGEKALFSMVIGSATEQWQTNSYYWQLYEITGLGVSDTPIITKVPNQPTQYNNISPIYGSDDRIIFTSDRPRNGERHLYPQLDEYELAPTNSGLWRLDSTDGTLELLNHAPSGNFTPIIDSYGRVIFTQWDHLQRDQQADAEAVGSNCYDGSPYGTFNYTDESANAAILSDRSEQFPEPRDCRDDLLAGTHLNGHRFNHFFPWQINEDGTDSEVLNHIGRHELHHYLNASYNNDPNIIEYYGQYPRYNENDIENMFHIQEDPTTLGTYYAIEAGEFGTHSAGQVIRINGTPTTDADHMAVTYITHPETADPSNNPTPNHSGLYRDVLPLTDGTLLAVHTAETREDENDGTRENPISRYDFRIKTLTLNGDNYWKASQPLTTGINENITYWDPDYFVTYNGELWELQPVAVRSRPRPTTPPFVLPDPEQQIFDQAGVTMAELQAYMRQRNLALVVSRNVTTRDDLDRQQPYNLRVPGGTQTIGTSGTIYDIAYMQFFQADQIRGWRGWGLDNPPRPGRRVLAQVMHEQTALSNNIPLTNAPEGAVALGSDGSMAAFVPTQRALTWQLTDEDGTGVVRERYWLTFQPGEIRVCASCHGLSQYDQTGATPPTNPPQALLDLLAYWQARQNLKPDSYLPLLQK